MPSLYFNESLCGKEEYSVGKENKNTKVKIQVGSITQRKKIKPQMHECHISSQRKTQIKYFHGEEWEGGG